MPATFSNVQYGVLAGSGGPALLDVYVPPGAPPPGGWPIVVGPHGGGWQLFDKADADHVAVMNFLQANGYLGFSPNFTGGTNSPAVHWPTACYDDCAAAVDWIRANATTYSGNVGRMATWGPSSGGHIALMLAYLRTDILAVVSFSGPTDLYTLWHRDKANLQDEVTACLGCTACPAEATYSPITYVATAPPTLMIHSTTDAVPKAQGTELKGLLDTAGRVSALTIVTGTLHGNELLNHGTTNADTLAWLGAYLTAPPQVGVPGVVLTRA